MGDVSGFTRFLYPTIAETSTYRPSAMKRLRLIQPFSNAYFKKRSLPVELSCERAIHHGKYALLLCGAFLQSSCDVDERAVLYACRSSIDQADMETQASFATDLARVVPRSSSEQCVRSTMRGKRMALVVDEVHPRVGRVLVYRQIGPRPLRKWLMFEDWARQATFYLKSGKVVRRVIL